MCQNINKYLLEDSKGTKWYFYLSEDNKLLFSVNTGGSWSKPAGVDRYSVKCFSATIDHRDKAYLLVYTHSRMLIYYEWDGYQWLHNIIYQTRSRFESIPFLSITTSQLTTHIFYYIENALRKSRESLVHFYLSKYEWKKGPALTFPSDEGVIPVDMVLDPSGNINFISYRKKNDKVLWYINTLENASSHWDAEQLLFTSKISPENTNIYIDKEKIVHFLLTEKKEDKYVLKYRNANLANLGQEEDIAKPILLDETVSAPIHIFGGKDMAECIWAVNNEIRIRETESVYAQNKRLKTASKDTVSTYVYKTIKNNKTPVCQIRMGDGYPDFSWAVGEGVEETTGEAAGGATGKTDSLVAPVNKVMIYQNEQTESSPHSEKYKKELSKLKKQIKSLSSQIDELYSSLVIIKDHLEERNRILFDLETTVKLLSNKVNAKPSNRFPASFQNKETYDKKSGIVITGSLDSTIGHKNESKSIDGQITCIDASRTDQESTDTSDVSSTDAKTIDTSKVTSDSVQNDKPTLNSTSYKTSSGIEVKTLTDEEVKEYENKNNKPEEINLGNVSIIINPEDDSL